ncbi:hypothetical protein [Aquibacillus kalidii]|uniref:hypothetical protein n=1 Tax=Aquibacillus kalidii TaxID=2762597 RepID=UPI0016489B1D|nr:hypothetical protein [Aquibacillus kalidii]
MLVLSVILVPIFLICLFVSLKFIWGEEGKDERGKQIITTSYMMSSPIFPIGWLIVESYHNYVDSLSFSVYRDCIWVLVLLTFIVQGSVIFKFKRQM